MVAVAAEECGQGLLRNVLKGSPEPGSFDPKS